MPVARDTPPSRTGYVVGSLWAAIGIALLWPTARGATALAHHHFTRGCVLVAGAVIGRAVTARMMTFVLDQLTASQRHQDRLAVMSRVAGSLPAPDVIASLLWASEHASGGIALDSLRAGAGVAVANGVLIFVFGGWQSVAVVVALVALAIPFYRHAGIVARDADAIFRRQRSDLTQRQLELLTNSLELRALGAVEFGADTVAALSDREHRSALKAIRASLGSSLVTEFLGGVSVGLVAMIVGFGLLRGHELLSSALLSIFASADLIGWIRRYGVAFHQREAVNEARSALASEGPSTTRPPSGVLVACRQLQTSAKAQPISLELKSGDRLALLGPSGSGKTSLVDTLLGLRTPTAGQVTRGEIVIGRVAIESQLLGATVRENLNLAAGASDDELRQALAEVGLDLPLDRMLSPDGAGLSTGERVRVVLARAFVHNASLIILDDIGGVLDSTARAAVQAAIARRMAVTVIECNVDEAVFIRPQATVTLP